jgi:hypothetical protein
MKVATVCCLLTIALQLRAENGPDNRLPVLLNEFADTVASFDNMTVKWEVRYENAKGVMQRTELIRTMYKGANYRQELASMNAQKKVDSRTVTLLSNGKVYSLMLPQRTMSVKKANEGELHTQEAPVFMPYSAIVNAKLPDIEMKPYAFEARSATLADFAPKGAFKAFSKLLESERDPSRLSQKSSGETIEVRVNTGARIGEFPVVNELVFPLKSDDTLYPSHVNRYFISKNAAGKVQEGRADTYTIREFTKVKYKSEKGQKTFVVPKISELAFAGQMPDDTTQKMIFTIESISINDEIDDAEFEPDLSQADSFFDRDSGKLIKQP